MKYKIGIPKPCSEDWENMSVEGKNRFCSNCQKTVHDFTVYSQTDLLKLLNTEKQLCGRLKKSQLTEAQQQKNLINPFTKVGIMFGFTAVFGVSAPALAQGGRIEKVEVRQSFEKQNIPAQNISDSISLKGKVVDEAGIRLPGVNVRIKDAHHGAQTDFDGIFEFKIPAELVEEHPKLQFSFLGMQEQEFSINGESANYQIVMKEDESFLGEVIVVGGVSSKPRNIFHRIGNFFKRIF